MGILDSLPHIAIHHWLHMVPSPKLTNQSEEPVTKEAAFTLTELLVVIAVIAILAAIVPASALVSGKHKAQRIMCVNNLKQIGTAYRVWPGDQTDNTPAMASIANGGWRDMLAKSNQGVNCWTNYAIMANELGQDPRVVVCPADERRPALNFIVKGTTNDHGNAGFKDNSTASYFVGVGASDADPSSFLGGDRNLSPGLTPKRDYGFSPPDGRGNDVTIQTNYAASPICWSGMMHSRNWNTNGAGNILLGDGSVQQCSSSRLRTDYQACAIDPRTPIDTHQGNWPTGMVPKEPSFRLIFP